MALSLFPASIEASRFASPSLYLPKLSLPRSKISQRDSELRFFRPQVGLSDPYVLELAEVLEESLPSTSLPTPLQKLRDLSAESLLATPWPTRKDEPFRFTDVSFIKSSKIQPILSPPDQSSEFFSLSEGTQPPNLFIGDGYLLKSASLSELPDGVYVGSLFDITSEPLLERISQFVSSSRGDLFWSLNGVGTPDWIVVYVPEGCKVEKPLHLSYFSIEGSAKESKSLPISNPRVLVLVERGGEIGIVEEYVGDDGDKCYWTNSVIEVIIGEEGKVKHSYIQTQSLSSAHIKWTSVKQESSSTYELIEVSTGGKLSRHNVHVQQQGPDTVTELSTFHLSTGSQTQDLHSKLVLDHPRGVSRQLHKCIVAHSLGQAVFDGNVQVNRNNPVVGEDLEKISYRNLLHVEESFPKYREPKIGIRFGNFGAIAYLYAQQTDAGQLTRSLLLEPRATVNVKPNLQIIADNVKCSHGAAISDLEEDQLFYFRARGINAETARRALIFSFAAEVVDRFPNSSVKKKVENHIKKLLDSTAS